ncbi:MAG: YidC/Oxa1 family insertase periplasmic-domain containing protein, partial [Gemmatimonadetes bacterium]|nr:YidC/Oxa1 family insertase periplasmic-domain containing protein [Gemmatimonadota bacterium]
APAATVGSATAGTPPRAPVPAAVAETLAVNTPLSHTIFSTAGAAPVAVELPGFSSLGRTKGAVRIHQRNEPLLRYRLLTGRDTIDLSAVNFTTTRLTHASGAQDVTFTGSAGNVGIRLSYSLTPDYLGTVTVTATNVAAPAFLLVDLPTGFVSQEGDTLDDINALAYAVKPQKGSAKGVPFRKLDPGEQRLEAGPMFWAIAKNKYFIVALLTPEKAPTIAEVNFTGGTRTSKMATRGMATAVLPLAADGTTNFDLYAGPQEWERMRALGRDFENANPYGGFLQGMVQPFATIVMRSLLWMKRTTELNYGWVLVIFGILIRLLMWPLNQKAMRASLKLQVLQPELQAVQAKYKADPQKQQQEIMKLYSEHGMSPLSPLLGCLPMLLPMPILFALFFVFQNTIEFRGVAFMWLPDISLKDPYYVLPLLMGASMYVLSWIGMRNAPPNPQAKMMAYLMPAMMTFFLINFASGLNLYYTVQNLAALPQQWLIANERLKETKAA